MPGRLKILRAQKAAGFADTFPAPRLIEIPAGRSDLCVVALYSNYFIKGCRGGPGNLLDGGYIQHADRGQAPSLPYYEFISSAHEMGALGSRTIQLDRARLAHLLSESSARHKPADLEEEIEAH